MSTVPKGLLIAAALLLVGPSTAVRAQAPGVGPATLAELDGLWNRRKQPGALEQLAASGQAALQDHPNDYEVAWRLARVFCWRSQILQDKKSVREAALAGMGYAETAIRLNPNRVEGQFLFGFGAGIYGTSIGVSEAFFRGVAPKFEKAMQRAYELDKDFQDGAPIVALGRYYYQLPWPLRDLERSAAYLEEARGTYPQSLFGRVYLAETYYALGREEAAREELEVVANADPDATEWQEPIQIARVDLANWFEVAVLASSRNNSPPSLP